MKYRLGKKQKRALLNDKGIEVALFKKGEEKLAYQVCELLNQKDYANGTAGDVAIMCGTAVGSLGCSHCGTTAHGTFYKNNCGWCDKPYLQ